ncbi:hypothetical protein IAU60_005768 [Kwoniella sp. DSM 27419]
MMYNPYQWYAGQGYNPYMMMGHESGQAGLLGHSATDVGTGGGGNDVQAYDPTKSKMGRMGHYGYLEGRELAGPPPGYMPAGVQPQVSQSAPGRTQVSPSRAISIPPSSTVHFPGSSMNGSVFGSGAGDGASAMAWGEPNATPRARYDGSIAGQGFIQADLDTPYPRTAQGGASSAFTRYGSDGSIINGIDGRLGISHKRPSEGRV